MSKSLCCAIVSAPLAFVALACGQVPLPAPPPMTVQYSIDGGPIKYATITASVMANGNFSYNKVFSTDAGTSLKIDYVADAKNDPVALMTGTVKFDNPSATSHTVDVSANVQLCSDIAGGTLIGGTVTLLVVADANGGGVTCMPGTPGLWQATMANVPVQTLFSCPFTMSTTGSGTMQSSSQFGIPIPSQAGPADASSAGFRDRFSITPGESLTVTALFVVKSNGYPDVCPADLDGNHWVDTADLGILLSEWGETGWCIRSDLNRDGVVNANDLAILFAGWGMCNSAQ